MELFMGDFGELERVFAGILICLMLFVDLFCYAVLQCPHGQPLHSQGFSVFLDSG